MYSAIISADGSTNMSNFRVSTSFEPPVIMSIPSLPICLMSFIESSALISILELKTSDLALINTMLHFPRVTRGLFGFGGLGEGAEEISALGGLGDTEYPTDSKA